MAGTLGRFAAVALAAAALACRTEPAAIVVEADTTAVLAGPARPAVVPAPAAEPEVVILEEAGEATLATGARAPGGAEEDGAPAAPAAAASDVAPAADGAVEDASDPSAAGRSVLPAGLVLPLELRTPLHSGTTRVGDRFAARTVAPVAVDGSAALAPGVLVEGRVAAVVRAGEEEPGAIEVDFRHLVLPDGERIALEAEIASVAGRPAGERRRAGAGEIAGSAAGGAVLGGAVGGSRGAVIGAVVGAVGATLVAGARDHEVVVPPGTRIDLVLTAPLELPARSASPTP